MRGGGKRPRAITTPSRTSVGFSQWRQAKSSSCNEADAMASFQRIEAGRSVATARARDHRRRRGSFDSEKVTAGVVGSSSTTKG